MTLEEDSGYTTIETRRHISRVRIFSKDGVFDLEKLKGELIMQIRVLHKEQPLLLLLDFA